MKQIGIIFILLAVFVLPTIAQNACESTSDEKSQQKAKQILEQSLSAIGGRERIRSIKNILYYDKKLNFVSLVVFPDKTWGWRNDGRPIGLSVRTYDYSKNVGYIVHKDDVEPFFSYTSSVQKRGNYLDELGFLLGTTWEPEILGVGSVKIKNREYEVVCTKLTGYIENGIKNIDLVDFIFDTETHLIFRKILYSKEKFGGGILSTDEYFDFTEVKGIKFAQHEISKLYNGTMLFNNKFKVEVDVEVRKDLFDRPPSIKDGPNGWKVKTK
jgi:hypothetical protein